jgi:AraC-like DNA-binding protein
MLSTDVDLVARGAAAALLLLSLTRLLADGGWRFPRRLGVAFFLLAVVGYLVCSAPGEPVRSGGGWIVLLALCLVGTPAFWLAARSVFDDRFRPTWTDAMVFAAFLALGLSAVGPWPDLLSGTASIAFRVVSLVLVVHALWIVLRDAHTDLVDRRRRLRVVLVGVVGLYQLAFLILEGYLGQTPERSSWSTLNVLGILVLAFASAVILTRDVTEVLLPPESRPVAGPLGVTTNRQAMKPASAIAETETSESGLRARLDSAMTEQRLYRQAGLTIAQLAERLGTSEHTLRRLINQRLGYRNFNDYLHYYRIAEASQRLRDEPGAQVLTIALDVGYASIGPFNRAFRQLLGTTPTQWRQGKSRV